MATPNAPAGAFARPASMQTTRARPPRLPPLPRSAGANSPPEFTVHGYDAVLSVGAKGSQIVLDTRDYTCSVGVPTGRMDRERYCRIG